MSRDSKVSSLPERAWSCSTLVEGIGLCAEKAGLKLKNASPEDVQQARMRKPRGVLPCMQPYHMIYCGAICMFVKYLNILRRSLQWWRRPSTIRFL